MKRHWWAFTLTLSLAFTCSGLQLAPCQSGVVAVLENSDSFSFTCDQYSDAVTWYYKTRTSLEQTIGTCNASSCQLNTGIPSGLFRLIFVNASSSRLSLSNQVTARRYGITYRCADSQANPQCQVNVVSHAVVPPSGLTFATTRWNLQGSSNITSVYSSLGRYSCSWTKRRETGQVTVIPGVTLTLTPNISDTSNTQNRTGTCTFSKGLPTDDGNLHIQCGDLACPTTYSKYNMQPGSIRAGKHEAQLHVQYRELPPSRLALTANPSTVSEGQQVIFDCSADGRPTPFMTLYNQVLDKEVTRQYSPLSHIMSRAQCEDAGHYTCTASNGVGSDQAEDVTLLVLCKSCFSFASANPRGENGQSGPMELPAVNFVGDPVSLNFNTTAYPSPHLHSFTFLGPDNTANGSNVDLTNITMNVSLSAEAAESSTTVLAIGLGAGLALTLPDRRHCLRLAVAGREWKLPCADKNWTLSTYLFLGSVVPVPVVPYELPDVEGEMDHVYSEANEDNRRDTTFLPETSKAAGQMAEPTPAPNFGKGRHQTDGMKNKPCELASRLMQWKEIWIMCIQEANEDNRPDTTFLTETPKRAGKKPKRQHGKPTKHQQRSEEIHLEPVQDQQSSGHEYENTAYEAPLYQNTMEK
ncbi:hypothetical protein BaRGS_00023194 [Batillaria attramentaria]|uniref:Ig-like domain-containing protein n=1 Tax=Batillaria attramentaria TaxID=370345 RepID=A0ABD0KEH4_9CAEN